MTVIVNGKKLVDEGRMIYVDEEKLVREVQEVGERIWSKIPENHHKNKKADEVSPQSFRLWG
jgi:hypothetical protein